MDIIRKGIRFFIAAGMAAALSACWLSDEPLIGADDRAAPAVEGKYLSNAEKQVTVTVTRQDDGRYRFDDGKEPIMLAFLALDGDWYLAEFEMRKDPEDVVGGEAAEPDGKEAFYLFQPMQIIDGDLHFHMPECDEAFADIEGLKADNKICEVETVGALRELSKRFLARLAAGEVTEEANVLKRID